MQATSTRNKVKIYELDLIIWLLSPFICPSISIQILYCKQLRTRIFAAGVINHLSLRSLTITLTVCSHDKAIQCSQKLQQDAPSATSIQVFHPQIHEQSSQAHSTLTGGEYLNNQV